MKCFWSTWLVVLVVFAAEFGHPLTSHAQGRWRRGARACCCPQVVCRPVCEPAPVATTPPAALSQATPAATPEGGVQASSNAAAWTSLFDGESLGQWRSTNFGGEGEVEAVDGMIVVGTGSPLSGITWSGEPPDGEYELEVEAQRLEGLDFFAGITFPVGDTCCSFIAGGWAGAVVGISSINGRDASENETTKYTVLAKKRWYKFRIRVTNDRIQCWIDDERYVDLDIQGKKLGTRVEVDLSRPLGIAAYECRATYRNIRWRPLSPAAERPREDATEEAVGK